MKWINVVRYVFVAWMMLCWSVHASSGCLLALTNDWRPMSVSERTQKSPVVLSGIVRAIQPTDKTDADTFRAQIDVADIYKGAELIKFVGGALNNNGVQRLEVPNFGHKSACYSDVQKGRKYIFFLSWDGERKQLEARYDDIFGAVAEWSPANLQSVLKAIGYSSWSEWSPCSVSCGGNGFQERIKKCGKNKCDILQKEKRTCNNFQCKGIRDLIEIFSFAKKKRRGLYPEPEREGSFRIENSNHLRLPCYAVFPYLKFFPSEFSLLTTYKLSRRNNDEGANILGITDENGRRRLALRVSKKQIELAYLNAMGLNTFRVKPAYFRVETPASRTPDDDDPQWKKLAFAFTKTRVHVYADCQLLSSFAFNRTFAGSDIPLSSILTIAYLPNTLKDLNFEGFIEQIIISTDPEAANQQCGVSTIINYPEVEDLVMDESYNSLEKDVGSGFSQSGDGQFVLEWSEWSECSVTCGKGVRKRSSYCVDSDDGFEECLEMNMERTETKLCYQKECPKLPLTTIDEKRNHRHSKKPQTYHVAPVNDDCSRKCQNGGTCFGANKCQCKTGYSGPHCEQVSCSGCLNDGKCVQPNVCVCKDGYSGSKCELVECKHPCKNGGRCVAPNKCICPYGFAPPLCTPICNPPCANNGKCLMPSKCKCIAGYEGSTCQTAVCEPSCKNGGRCASPHNCNCPTGYSGKFCETPTCNPQCQNGGKCTSPNICTCRAGFFGNLCEKPICDYACENGGVCVAPNKCNCPHLFTGTKCTTPICKGPCLNGGKCLSSKCQCLNGYYGVNCEKVKCKRYGLVTEPFQKSYKRKVQDLGKEICGIWNWKTCSKSKISDLEYKTAQKTFFKGKYACIDPPN